MEADAAGVSQMPGIVPRLFPAVGPMLLISMGYIDPGKWSAVVEGGSRFGFDLVLLLLVFNCAAILCQYLAACVGVVTGKNLAQICSEEYGRSICLFLGIQAELSVLVLDLTMILGIAHGLNLLFGVNLFTCLLITAVDALLFPLLSTVLEKCWSEFVFISTAGFILLCYVLGVLTSQPEIPLAMNGVLSRLTGETAFTLMSLLGASIMPHNFYLHSSIVQQQQQQLKPQHISKSAVCFDHFFSILCIFSGICLANYVMMSASATFFNRAGLVVLTFQDVLLLMDQVLGSPTAAFLFFLILYTSSHITALTWSLGGQVVLHDLLRMNVPRSLHRTIIRILAIVLALCCSWRSGSEGLYQMLIFTQVLLAMMLPSSVLPLFRVASSKSIMGTFKMSQFVEFLMLTILIGMLGLNIIFIVELLFGDSDWVGSLKWNMGSSMDFPYVILLLTACASLVLILWLAATPLKSATVRPDGQIWNLDLPNTSREPPIREEESDKIEPIYHGEESDTIEPRYHGEESDTIKPRYHEAESDTTKPRYHEEQSDTIKPRYHEEVHDTIKPRYLEAEAVAEETSRPVEKSPESSDGSVVDDFDLPESFIDSDQEPHLPAVEENHTTDRSSPTYEPDESTSRTGLDSVVIVDKEVSTAGVLDIDILEKIKSIDLDGKTVGVGRDLQNDLGDIWGPEETSTTTFEAGPSLTSEGSGSFRSLSAKTDEVGNGSGSLSRLPGLGRAARRQLAAILDEFWGQLYDFHGQATQEARAKKLDMLFGLDTNLVSASPRVDSVVTGSSGYFPSVAERGSSCLISSSTYDLPKQQRIPMTVDSPYGVQTGSSSLFANMQLLGEYGQGSSYGGLDSGEKRYSSLRLPPSSEVWNQPATVHGYQMASYLNRIATDRNVDSLNTLLGPGTPKSPSSTSFTRSSYKDPYSYALGQTQQNRNNSVSASITQNPVMSRVNRVQPDRPYYDQSSGTGENVGSPAYTKKYHSLPDISGLALPHRESYATERRSHLGGPPGFGPPVGRGAYEKSLQPPTGFRAGASLVDVSPSNLYRDSFSVDLNSKPSTKSLWSRQPYDQLYAMEGKSHNMGEEVVGRKTSLLLPEIAFHAELESKMLQSFRNFIIRLLKLEGSDWLFSLDGGADEDLIDRVAARERYIFDVENKDTSQVFPLKNEEVPLPHCGEFCIWRVDLIVSFGVWCIHRILELSRIESRPELWGKYTYVLNRLQGILDPAFTKPRSPYPPCFCLQVPASHAKRFSTALPNGNLSPASKLVKGKCTSAAALLDIIKDVEGAVSCRKGRTGTAAGDVAFPKGKENLASVLKRYKRRLTNKAAGSVDSGSGLRKVPMPSSYAL